MTELRYVLNKFRYFTLSDLSDDSPHWSRCYEWCYVLEMLKINPTLARVHNTAVGPERIHEFFARRLSELRPETVHSDFVETSINQKFPNFRRYSLLEKSEETFDCVLCISTLEELKTEAEMRLAFQNLLEQTRVGGRLIVTCDVPDVTEEFLQRLVGADIQHDGVPVNGSNSVFPDPRFSGLKVVLIDLIRE